MIFLTRILFLKKVWLNNYQDKYSTQFKKDDEVEREYFDESFLSVVKPEATK
ncbi:hypothetical protein [Mesomycoplasma flocculare]|uniref:hypothetical protein n=1 Tax=Mesomycoplasma flocculare TaxID=2128 RepID=UPI00136E4A42|nr:hypothetical protein [Mesomycoplasma flocculare]